MPLPSKAEKKSGTVSITFKDSPREYQRNLVFNSYYIEWLDYGVLLHFAYVTTGVSHDPYSVLLDTDGLEHFILSSKQYLGGIGAPTTTPRHLFKPGPMSAPPVFSNNLRFARGGNIGELAFFTIPLFRIAEVAKESKTSLPVTVEPLKIALLHSDLETHRNVVFELVANHSTS